MKVPTALSHERYDPDGSCRMCVVELENNGRLVPSCSFPASPEMKIKTHSPRVVDAKKNHR
ncbi:MAG: 2Fe-2S iron-sulfur cluster-binding protein [Ignavibacteriales bacterium]|nr:2Fe-2S iron-sulfur cluster-binding protein [Ignavibacteriales bacterium]